MAQYRYKLTQALAEAFEDAGFEVQTAFEANTEALMVPLPVENGPELTLQYIVREEDGTISMRVFDVVRGIPSEKYGTMLAACNHINGSIRYLKFVLDAVSNSIGIRYDFPIIEDRKTAGRQILGMSHMVYRVLKEYYPFLICALYSDGRKAQSDFCKTEDEASGNGEDGQGSNKQMMS